MKLINRVKDTWKQIFEEITVWEYVSWWVVRILLLIAVIFAATPEYRKLDGLNMCTCYAMSLIRFIAPRGSFMGRLSFRCQHLINIAEIFGTFFGHFLNGYSHVVKYDRVLHYMSGVVGVIAGYYIYKALSQKDIKKHVTNLGLASFSSFSFSFVIITLWEVQEFFSDFFIGSQNQGYYYAPDKDDIFFKVFGMGANGGEGQFPLWDTMMDMMDAALTTLITTVVLYVSLKLIKRSKEKKQLS